MDQEKKEALKQPDSEWWVLINKYRNFGKASIEIAERSDRQKVVQGAENLDQNGGFILVFNHFVADPSEPLTEKWREAAEFIGIITKETKKVIPEDHQLIWLGPYKPRSAIFDTTGDKLPQEVSLSTDTIRETALKNAVDAIPFIYSPESIDELYRKVKENLDKGNVIAITSQSSTSTELQKAEGGFARMAITSQVPVIPVATYSNTESIFVSFGKSISPPNDQSQKQQFTENVMSSLASMLPPSLRGYYQTA